MTDLIQRLQTWAGWCHVQNIKAEVQAVLYEAADELERTKLYDTIAHANEVQAEEIQRLQHCEATAKSMASERDRLRAERDELLRGVNEDEGYEKLKAVLELYKALQSALRRFKPAFRFRDLRPKAQTDRPDADILGHAGQMRDRYHKRRRLSAVK